MEFLFNHSHGIFFAAYFLFLVAFVIKTWKGFTSKALSEQDGLPSSKREVGFLFAILGMILCAYVVIFKSTIPDNVMYLLGAVILGNQGLAAAIDIASYFGKKSDTKTE